jgi:hypothetical protein
MLTGKDGEWRRGRGRKELGFWSVSWCIKEGKKGRWLASGREEKDHVVMDMFVQKEEEIQKALLVKTELGWAW